MMCVYVCGDLEAVSAVECTGVRQVLQIRGDSASEQEPACQRVVLISVQSQPDELRNRT